MMVFLAPRTRPNDRRRRKNEKNEKNERTAQTIEREAALRQDN